MEIGKTYRLTHNRRMAECYRGKECRLTAIERGVVTVLVNGINRTFTVDRWSEYIVGSANKQTWDGNVLAFRFI